MVKGILQMELAGKGQRGKPKRRVKDVVSEDLPVASRCDRRQKWTQTFHSGKPVMGTVGGTCLILILIPSPKQNSIDIGGDENDP